MMNFQMQGPHCTCKSCKYLISVPDIAKILLQIHPAFPSHLLYLPWAGHAGHFGDQLPSPDAQKHTHIKWRTGPM